MNTTEIQTSLNIGVDVGRANLDVALHPSGQFYSIPNSEAHIRRFVKILKNYDIERIVVEATGRHEHALVQACNQAGLPIIVVNPTSVRRFAQAIGVLAKTDRIDAKVIAKYAATLKPEFRPIPDKTSQKIRDLLARRAQLLEMSTMEKNRLQIMPKCLHRSIKALLRMLQSQIETITRQIEQEVTKADHWRTKMEIMTSVPGVAPINRDSGKLNGKRRIRGGRPRVRTVSSWPCSHLFSATPFSNAFMNALKLRERFQKLPSLPACER